MKVVIITGSYPPDVCGVGYYSRQLAEALRTQGAVVEIMIAEDWSLPNIGGIFRKIDSLRPDIVHIQYPTVGYRYHLTPQILSNLFPSVVTIHEVSQAHILRKLSLLLFSLRSRQIVFTSSFERKYALAWAPWIAKKSRIVPIGNNLGTVQSDTRRDLGDIIYFGIIRPNKGIEDIMELATLIKRMSFPYTVRIIGCKHECCAQYSDDLIRQSKDLPVHWEMDLPDNEVSNLLSRACVAYVPYPDGASERRGTLLALLAHGVPTITTKGPQTPSSLTGAVEFAQSPSAALPLVDRLAGDAEYREQLSERARMYATKFSWEHIAKEHLEIYKRILGNPS